jgi:hypothetical protein
MCSISSSGLSHYRPDGRNTAHKFHLVGDDYYCGECHEEYKDVEYDFNLEDYLSEDEQESAFEYE